MVSIVCCLVTGSHVWILYALCWTVAHQISVQCFILVVYVISVQYHRVYMLCDFILVLDFGVYVRFWVQWVGVCVWDFSPMLHLWCVCVCVLVNQALLWDVFCSITLYTSNISQIYFKFSNSHIKKGNMKQMKFI